MSVNQKRAGNVNWGLYLLIISLSCFCDISLPMIRTSLYHKQMACNFSWPWGICWVKLLFVVVWKGGKKGVEETARLMLKWYIFFFGVQWWFGTDDVFVGPRLRGYQDCPLSISSSSYASTHTLEEWYSSSSFILTSTRAFRMFSFTCFFMYLVFILNSLNNLF